LRAVVVEFDLPWAMFDRLAKQSPYRKDAA
jgi:hypothetical protein